VSMIRVGKLTDYALVLMTHMGRSPADRVHTARQLAAESGVPLPTVSKVLKTLLQAGLLVSYRGIKGGYSLARAAREISVGQILKVLEGPIGVTECGGVPGLCELEPHCPMTSNWRVISLAVRQAMENLTLLDLIYPLELAGKNNLLIPATHLSSGRTQ